MHPRRLSRGWTLLTLLLLWSAQAIAAPVNDNFANAIAITNYPAIIAGDNFGATIEPGEFARTGYPVEGSVWWKWTAPFTGRIGIADNGSPGNPWLKVCVGTGVSSLTNLISENLYLFHVLNVTEGTTYYFDVDRNMNSGDGGPFEFRLVTFPVNDNFSDALPVTGGMLETFGDGSFATTEPGEPDYTAGGPDGSIWWNWSAPEPGSYRITGGPGLHIFTGNSVSNLTLVALSYGQGATLNASTGAVYHIRITGGGENVRLAIYPPVPLNDDFTNRMSLSGSPVDQLGTTVGATAEAGDPILYLVPGGYTVWYSWTAPESGRVQISAMNLTGHPLIPRFRAGIFTGTQLASLQKLAGGQDGTSATVIAGQTYVIGVDGDAGDFRLTLNLVPHPANDNFVNRLILSGPTAAVTNDNFAATLEAGEKPPTKNMANASLWYEWTAPADGLARAVAQAGFAPAVCVYQGTSVKNLKRVANSLATTESATVLCTFRAKAGNTYVMSVDGLYSGGRGGIIFGVDLTTFVITNPVAGKLISSAAPPKFQVNQPLPAVDGILTGVSYLAAAPDGEVRIVGESVDPPFAAVPTNLPAGIVTLLAIGTNSVGDQRVTAPVVIKVSPINDDFAQSISVTGYQWQASGFTAQATREPGEPNRGSASVWWSWTAPSSGRLSLVAQLGDEDSPLSKRTVSVYTGSDVRSLTPVPPTAKGGLVFPVTGGTTYHLAVAAKNPNLDPGTWPFLVSGSLESLSFNEPANSEFHEPADVPIGITTSEDPAVIQRVDFLASDGYTNRQLIATFTAPPFRFVYTNMPPGNYSLEARLTRSTPPNPPPVSRQFSVRPINDDFTNRIMLQTNFSWLTHRVAGASRQPGEPAHNGDAFAPSAWWSWTAPVDGELHLSDPSGATAAGFAIYAGTNLASLTPLTNNAYPPYAYNWQTQLRGGTTYQIAAIPGPTPDVNAQLRFFPPPINDNFTNRLTLTGSSVSFESYTVSATREPDEPDRLGVGGGEHTIWWTWTSPGRGYVTLTMYAGTYVYNRVYTGETLASLQGVSSGGSLAPASFETLSNMTCQIMLAGDYGGEERDGVHLQFTPTVTNDLFSTRAEIEGTNLTLIAHNLGATTEAGEPPLAPGASGRTLWYSWTAPADGMLYLRVATSSVLPHGTTMLDVFQGDSPATLEPVSNGSGFGGDHIYFHVVSNETYQIRFDAGGPTWDAIPVQLDFIAAPPNDQFINATILSGLDLSSNGTIRGASPETNDPRVWLGAGNSVWYSWTAPQSGSVIVAVADAADFYALQAFTGPDLAHLTVAGVRHQADSVLLNAQAGTNYYFAVAGVQMWEPDEPGKGPFRLLLTPGTTPANDNFSNAGMLAGTSDSIVATNWVATLEADDPPIVQWFHLQRTLWYQWHAPGAGLLLLTNNGSTVNPIVGVYLGTNLSQLSMIGDRETPVRSNETVHILLDGDYGAGGVLRIGLEFLPAPANDDFAQAFSITGTSCVLTGYVRTATGESTNPGDRFRYDYRDIWWKWTAPGTGQVVITNVQPDSSTSVRVYAAGTNGPQLIGALQFDAVEGASYWVQATWGAAAGSDHVNLLLTESIGAMPSASQMTAAKLTAPIPLRLDLPRLLPDGRFAFHIQGPAGTPFQLEHSSDLAHWQILQTGVLTNDDQEVIDTEAGQAQMRFYRVR